GTPPDVVAVDSGAPHDVVAGRGAPDDVVGVARRRAASRAPDDVVAIVGSGHAPRGTDTEGIGAQTQHAAAKAVVAPDDVLAPHLLAGYAIATLCIGAKP